MANIKSKKKNIKQIEKRTLKNRVIKSITKTAIKKARKMIIEKHDDAIKFVSIAKKAINTAVSKGVFHKNNGARKQSKLDAFVKKNSQ